jgi:hypothetical protein
MRLHFRLGTMLVGVAVVALGLGTLAWMRRLSPAGLNILMVLVGMVAFVGCNWPRTYSRQAR